ncbi:hypothetical protein [Photorhabdus heterorhabditis]|uniref:Uncharacterized protein n=1 Tax=Photorhabdus heterorhabditis TaxID=880156 RepID=A0A5B0XA78_9GAMM|nr:hypothetical protein [Photorhabdus heterorhabditis]KAA1195505.1 hypothetical protein F0L16_02145 [Photorhabdus heterorhabditis]KOY62985.1 hypothetical protein AM629_05355 [Photorhabdus heterorhabditis]MBS9441030.1 hypothetical protein [Photorhabdus heterorhabditis]
MEEKENFLPLLELDGAFFKQFNRVAGKRFDNEDLSIDFNGLHNTDDLEQDVFLLRIEHVGISGEFYLSCLEARRILNVDTKLFSPSYLEYIFTHHMGKYGIQFERYISKSEREQQSILVSAKAKIHDEYYSILCDLNYLKIDSEYLRGRKRSWPGTLKLSLDVILFETLLETQEIRDLSNEDLVLLCDK